MQIADINELKELVGEFYKLQGQIGSLKIEGQGVTIYNVKVNWTILSQETRERIKADLQARFDYVKSKLMLVGVTHF